MSEGAPVTLFYSYAHEDEALRDELQGHLKILERRGLIKGWHDRRIPAGASWGGEIDIHLRQADIVLLLVSKDFVSSDYIWGVELAAAMQRHERGEARVVPVLVRSVDLDPEDTPFMKLQGLPTDLKPVTSWSNRDEAWTNVAKGLRAAVQEIRARRASAPAAAPAPPPAPAPAPRFRKPLQPAVHAIPAHEHRPANVAKDVSAAHDPWLLRVVAGFTDQMTEAGVHHGGAVADGATLARQAVALIDASDPPRVLWVDDRPENNRLECAALAKLQIEVITARSTQEALDLLAKDKEGFDLVISDWNRHEGSELPDGLNLLQLMRQQGHHEPVVYYHGAFDARQRSERAQQARDAGAFGEAVLPGELMELILKTLAH